jgi:hypothetical protein
MPLESTIENHLSSRVKALGGLSLKGAVPGHRFLDRICILPDGVTLWVECKRPGGARRALQELTVRQLLDLGHFAFLVESKDEVDLILDGTRFFDDDGDLVVARAGNVFDFYTSTPRGLKHWKG